MEVFDQTVQDLINDQDKEKVIKGFHLVPAKFGFGRPYTTTEDRPSLILKKEINNFIKNKLGNNDLYVDIEKHYKNIHFLVKHKK